MSGAQLLGALALQQTFESLADADNYDASLSRITLQIERDAKRNAPVDTGNLRASLSSEVRREGADKIAGYVGTNVKYAPFVEMGTSRMGAQPFLRPAVEENRETIEDELGATIEELSNE